MILGYETLFKIIEDGLLIHEKQIYLSKDRTLKDEVLKEAHGSRVIIHPGSTKMYKDLNEFYWRLKMKKQIAEYIVGCAVCQQVKAEHQMLVRPLQPLLIP